MSSPNAGNSSWAPVMRLLPLLALFILHVLLKAKDGLVGDEGRYLIGADNILHGFLASEKSLFLWNGPGYPLYLAPFVALGLPLLLAKLGNALFLFLALVRFHGALRILAPREGSIAVTYGLGAVLFLHGAAMELLMTESLSAFLVCGAAYHYLQAVKAAAGAKAIAAGKPGDGSDRHLVRPGLAPAALSALHLGFLALTKVFFGYALAAGLIASGAWWAWGAWRRFRRGAVEAPGPALEESESLAAARHGVLVNGLALVVCLPYLVHTYALTGKAFFWSNSGGSQLYCMTLPEKEMLGDWLNFDAVLAFPDFFRNQAPFYRILAEMDYVRRDQAMKVAAIRNIRAYPGKYFRNWRANVNRMVFGYPVSRYPGSDSELATGNRSFVYALPFFLCLFAAPAAWSRRRRVPAGAHACLFFAAASLGGLSLLSAFPRLVFPLLPLLALWLGAVRGASRRGMDQGR